MVVGRISPYVPLPIELSIKVLVLDSSVRMSKSDPTGRESLSCNSVRLKPSALKSDAIRIVIELVLRSGARCNATNGVRAPDSPTARARRSGNPSPSMSRAKDMPKPNASANGLPCNTGGIRMSSHA